MNLTLTEVLNLMGISWLAGLYTGWFIREHQGEILRRLRR